MAKDTDNTIKIAKTDMKEYNKENSVSNSTDIPDDTFGCITLAQIILAVVVTVFLLFLSMDIHNQFPAWGVLN